MMQTELKISKIPNGTFTIVSVTGQHRTFQLSTCRFGKNIGKRFVSMLQDNNNYRGFAMVFGDEIKVWQSKQTADKNSFYERCARMLQSIFLDGEKSPFMKNIKEIKPTNRCIRCNRKLTNPDSLDAGMGPECRGKGML